MAGAMLQGHISMATTALTAAIDDSATTITVSSTNGFPAAGIIVIGDERIAYSTTTATQFKGTTWSPLVRGTSDTTAANHSIGDRVRTVESAMMNQSAAYNIAVIADSSGAWSAITVSLAVMRLIGSYLILPTSFLGTDLQIIAYLWWIGVAGMVLSIGLALAGSRRVV